MTQDPFRLDGRCTVVVGAGGGIGRGVALAFARAGGAVGCVDHDGATAEATAALIRAAGGEALGVRCDITSEGDVTAAVKSIVAALGPVRALLNGAAADDPNGDVTEIDPATWNRVFAVNVTGAYLMSRAIIAGMKAAGGGSIMHVASQFGRVAAARRVVYCATKGALVQMAKAMALDHAKDGIRVNTLSPGAVETRRMLIRYGDMETARARILPKYPIGRLGQPEDIGHAAVYLASDASAFMTGNDLLVDGGYAAQ
jgi:NAD(P)-dependent dehydrogenase (short-subunit alcohol dehydrogenase family)